MREKDLQEEQLGTCRSTADDVVFDLKAIPKPGTRFGRGSDMAKNLSAPAVLRHAVDIGVIPSGAEIHRRQTTWDRDGLHHLAWLSNRPPGALSWNLNVGDAKFGPRLEGYGSFAVMVRSDDNSMPWPSKASGELDEFLLRGIGEAATLVSDRLDLAELLASTGDVHRGSVFVWLPPSNYTSRLVLAMILARDLGRDDLVGEYRARLEHAPSIATFGGGVLEAVPEGRRSAKQFEKLLGFCVTDLIDP